MEGREGKGRKGRRRNDRLVSPSRGRMDGKTEEARMAEAASFGQVASPERADLPLHLAWARFLALRQRRDAAVVGRASGRFAQITAVLFRPEKKRGSAKSRRVRVTTERLPSLGEFGQFGTGRERNAITHVPRGSRTRPPQYRGRPQATWATSSATDHRCIWNSADVILRSAVVVVAGYGRSLRESGKLRPERTKELWVIHK